MTFKPQQLEPKDVAALLKSDKGGGGSGYHRDKSTLSKIMGATSGRLGPSPLPLCGGLLLPIQTGIEEFLLLTSDFREPRLGKQRGGKTHLRHVWSSGSGTGLGACRPRLAP